MSEQSSPQPASSDHDETTAADAGPMQEAASEVAATLAQAPQGLIPEPVAKAIASQEPQSQDAETGPAAQPGADAPAETDAGPQPCESLATQAAPEVSARLEEPETAESVELPEPVQSADPAEVAPWIEGARPGEPAGPTSPAGATHAESGVAPVVQAEDAGALDRLETQLREASPVPTEPGPLADASGEAAVFEPGTPTEPGPSVGTLASRTPDPTPKPYAPAGAAAPAPTPPAGVPVPSATPADAGQPLAPRSESAKFGRVADDGTVYVRTPEGEKPVGSYPGAPAQEALAYFARKFDEVDALADLLYQRVTQTDLSAKDAAESLTKLREASADLNAVGDLVALQAKVENIATALEARRVVESEQRAAARAEALAKREEIVAEAERIAGQPENKVQWKSSSARMRVLLDEWKAAQRGGPKLEREAEQALWQRLSSSRNSFDKMRRVHFAQLGSAQSQAKAAKEELVQEAEQLATSTDWGATAGAYKRLMDRWRQAGRASRMEDDALWKRFKAAQDSFFNAKDAVVAAENEEFRANLVVKEELLTQARALLPVRDLEATKSALRTIQEKWDAAGKVPRADMDRIEKGMRRVEQTVREAEDKRWKTSNPEVAARAASLASQAEAALQRYRRDLEKAEASGDQRRITKAREALEAREGWLKQARAGLAEFGS